MSTVHVLPLWEKPDGTRRLPQPGEVRDDLPCVGWCVAAEIEVRGEGRWFLLTKEDELDDLEEADDQDGDGDELDPGAGP